jgi:hypothetical protein
MTSIDKAAAVSSWDVSLCDCDRESVLDPSGWYTSTAIKVFQELLEQQRNVGTLQDPLVGHHAEFGYVYNASNRAQIVLVNRNHWIVIALNKNLGSVHVYDSMALPTKKPSIELVTLSKKVFNTDFIKYEPCQQQTNGHDCGPFACAFLELLSRGADPSQYTFPQPRALRQELSRMLLLNKVRPFFAVPK